MPELVFRLRNVPEDEADEVRALMDENDIDWYETSAGNWGIAMPGIWVKNPEDSHRARIHIDAYQQERRTVLREQHQRALENGDAPSLWQRIQEKPGQVAGITAFCLFILYVSINPFLQLIGYSQ